MMLTCLCGKEINTSNSRGKQRRYCSDACRQADYRNRMKASKIVAIKPSEIKPILKYPGAKWQRADWILSYIPDHKQYLEPYCGSAAIFLKKKPANHEIINDINGQIVNLFRVIRNRCDKLIDLIQLTPWARDEYESSYKLCDDEVESARRFLVRCWQAYGTRLNIKTGWRHRGPQSSGSTTSLWEQLPKRLQKILHRLQNAEIENKPAIEIIKEYPHACLYVDPPYEPSTRTGALYSHEMSTSEHLELLDILNQHLGPVILSGYAHPIYDTRLPHWHRVTMPSVAEKGQKRTEVLWINEIAWQQLDIKNRKEDIQRSQMKMFEDEVVEVAQ